MIHAKHTSLTLAACYVNYFWIYVLSDNIPATIL